jgi:ribosomal protein L11 methyltransferase
VPDGVIPIRIEAGLAFGTGHHETTALCLSVLSDIAHRPFRNVLDLGSGTGLLAIGAAKLWRRPVLASDIDPVAVEVTDENARANGVAPLVRAVVADGLIHPTLSANAPYDLIIANILAGPLTRLVPQIVGALKPGGLLILSGLLHNQEAMIQSFYHRLRFLGRHRDGPWSALVMEKAGR